MSEIAILSQVCEFLLAFLVLNNKRLFGLSVVLYFIKILIGSRNLRYLAMVVEYRSTLKFGKSKSNSKTLLSVNGKYALFAERACLTAQTE